MCFPSMINGASPPNEIELKMHWVSRMQFYKPNSKSLSRWHPFVIIIIMSPSHHVISQEDNLHSLYVVIIILLDITIHHHKGMHIHPH